MKQGELITIGDIVYKYDSCYDRLEENEDENTEPAIACPKCFNIEFTIAYGVYECIAVCRCGHRMTIYDG